MIHWDEIDRIVKAEFSTDPTSSEATLLRQLKLWWCNKFNRPLKDPLLEQYSLEELAYEYLVWFYMNPDNDPTKQVKEQARKQDEENWALEQLRKIQEKQKNAKKNAEPQKAPEPPVNIPDLPEVSTNFKE
jgi:5-methylcytosine-specific restriction endonuclease McrA